MAILHPSEGPTARAFGASVAVTATDGGLCLVVGRDASIGTTIRAHGLRPVADLGGRRLLCMATLEQMTRLRGEPSVALAGPVSVDRERLRRFGRLVGSPVLS